MEYELHFMSLVFVLSGDIHLSPRVRTMVMRIIHKGLDIWTCHDFCTEV